MEIDQDQGFEVLYEQGPCLVVLKPGGVLTQAPPGIDSLEVRIKRFLKRRDGKSGKVYLGVPHRLDRPVSGAMVFGKNARATRRLSEQFEGRMVRKTYWAVVGGDVRPDQGQWKDYVRKVPDQARAEVVGPRHEHGRPAVLYYHVLSRIEGGTWLEIELETGRTHQIRVQAASRGYPLWGDAQYGSAIPFGPQCKDPRQRRIGLHARTLTLRHPTSRQRVSVTAPLPPDWGFLQCQSPNGELSEQSENSDFAGLPPT